MFERQNLCNKLLLSNKIYKFMLPALLIKFIFLLNELPMLTLSLEIKIS